MEKVQVQFDEAAGMVRKRWNGEADPATNLQALKDDIKDAVERGVLYAVLEIESPTVKGPFLVSGNLLRLSSYLTQAVEDMRRFADPKIKSGTIKVTVVAYTTDRNEARKQADEV